MKKHMVNVGTIGHTDHHGIQEMLVVVEGMFIGMPNELIEIAQRENELNFSIEEYGGDIKPMMANDDQSWQKMNKGKFSKKARRKL